MAAVILDGNEALLETLRSTGENIPGIVAKYALFTHPLTVASLSTVGLFRTVRNMSKRGQWDDERRVMYDDNMSPALAFRWANDLTPTQLRHVQYNHISPDSDNPESYTSLANIFVSPKFVAYLSDTSREVRALLIYHSWQLYGSSPICRAPPTMPEGYDKLAWCAPLPEIKNPIEIIRSRLARKSSNRVKRCVERFGSHLDVQSSISKS